VPFYNLMCSAKTYIVWYYINVLQLKGAYITVVGWDVNSFVDLDAGGNVEADISTELCLHAMDYCWGEKASMLLCQWPTHISACVFKCRVSLRSSLMSKLST